MAQPQLVCHRNPLTGRSEWIVDDEPHVSDTLIANSDHIGAFISFLVAFSYHSGIHLNSKTRIYIRTRQTWWRIANATAATTAQLRAQCIANPREGDACSISAPARVYSD
jgi:hypothetical protein